VGTITIPCPANIHYGCISASGKSFTFRTREKAEGPVSEYRNIRLPFKIQDFKKGFYHKSDLFRYDFGQGEEPAVIIKYHKI
jgi:hypothetical protein